MSWGSSMSYNNSSGEATIFHCKSHVPACTDTRFAIFVLCPTPGRTDVEEVPWPLQENLSLFLESSTCFWNWDEI